MGSTPSSLEGDSDLVIHAHRLREEILAHPGTTPPEAEDFLARCEAAGAHGAAALVDGALASAYREAQRVGNGVRIRAAQKARLLPQVRAALQ